MSRRFFGIDEMKETTSETPTKDESTGPDTVNGEIYNAACVNVREYPKPMAKVLEVLNKGEKVKIMGKESGFCKVSTPNGFIGYIVAMYVKEV